MGKSLIPMFSADQVLRRIDNFAKAREKKAVSFLVYVGNEVVNAARNTRTYKDQTGNLRSSIGYVVIYGGAIAHKNTKQVKSGNKGLEKVEQLIMEQKGGNLRGWALIVFAGMEYAAAVESRNLDVLSGSVKSKADLVRELKKELGLES